MAGGVAGAVERSGRMIRFTTPVSSSMVSKTMPEAVPGRWRIKHQAGHLHPSALLACESLAAVMMFIFSSSAAAARADAVLSDRPAVR